MTRTKRAIGGHHRPYEGGSNDWLTPPDLIEILGPFDLDPCASVGQPWRTAATQYTAADDGLAMSWAGFAWVNPPYGPNVGLWLKRLAAHGNGLALIFARTETAWFHNHVWRDAGSLFFFAGRLHFHRPRTGERMPANAGAPSVLIGYGAEAGARLHGLAKRWAGRLLFLDNGR